VIASVPVGDGPGCAAYDSRDGEVYVVNTWSANVSVINGTSVVASIPVGELPMCPTYDNGDGYVYVTHGNSSNVSVIDRNSAIATIRVGFLPQSMAYDPRDGDLYVADLGTHQDQLNGPGNVTVIRGTSIVGVITVRYPTFAVVYDDSNGYVYALSSAPSICALTCEFPGFVSVIDGLSLVGTLPVTNGSTFLTYDGGNGEVYVGDSIPTGLQVINGTSLGVNIPVKSTSTSFLTGALYDDFNGNIYVSLTNETNNVPGDGHVVVVRGASILATIPVGNGTSPGDYDVRSGVAYEPNWGSNNVSVIENSSVVATLGVGFGPTAAVYDAADGYVYVPNEASNNVSVIATPFPPLEANFSEGDNFTGSCQSLSVTVGLVGSASGGDPPYQRFTWSFGPGYPLSYGAEVNHTFPSAGTYNVTLVVLDSEGVNASVTHTVNIPALPTCPPIRSTGAPVPPTWGEFSVILGATAMGFIAMAAVVWRLGRQKRPPRAPRSL